MRESLSRHQQLSGCTMMLSGLQVIDQLSLVLHRRRCCVIVWTALLACCTNPYWPFPFCHTSVRYSFNPCSNPQPYTWQQQSCRLPPSTALAYFTYLSQEKAHRTLAQDFPRHTTLTLCVLTRSRGCPLEVAAFITGKMPGTTTMCGNHTFIGHQQDMTTQHSYSKAQVTG